MNVAILVSSYPPTINSAAHLYCELAESLSALGHDVTVITRFPDSQALPAKEMMKGVKVFRLPRLDLLSKIPGGKPLRYLLLCLLFSVRACFAGSWDVILVYSPPLCMGLAGYVAARLTGNHFVFDMQDIHPKVLIDMGFVRSPLFTKLLSEMEDFVYKQAYAILVYSEGNKEYLTKKGVDSDKVIIIPNWVDTEAVAPAGKMNEFRKMSNLGGKFIVSYAGSMARSRHLRAIVETAMLLRGYRDIVFLLVGDGRVKPLLQKMVNRNSLENVVFLPFQPKEKYVDVLNASDVCLLPLSKDVPPQTVPGKLANLMACGRPIIASVNQKGDTAQIIDRADCGICVEPGDPKELSRAVLRLYDDKELGKRMGKMGREYAEQEFSRTVCIQKYEYILREAAAA
jgi:glycosyltransferase involved in cell wall biosynthesis